MGLGGRRFFCAFYVCAVLFLLIPYLQDIELDVFSMYACVRFVAVRHYAFFLPSLYCMLAFRVCCLFCMPPNIHIPLPACHQPSSPSSLSPVAVFVALPYCNCLLPLRLGFFILCALFVLCFVDMFSRVFVCLQTYILSPFCFIQDRGGTSPSLRLCHLHCTACMPHLPPLSISGYLFLF